jgi:hypothetical protein
MGGGITLVPRRWQFTIRSVLGAMALAGVALAFGIRGLYLATTIWMTANFLAQRKWGYASALVCAFVLFSCLGLGSTFQVRLDSGDQRICFWGIPTFHRSIDAEARNSLLSLNGSEVPKRWATFHARFGLRYDTRIARDYYEEAAEWVNVDPAIAELILSDLASHVVRGRTDQPPECSAMLYFTGIQWEGRVRSVAANWRADPHVQRYLASKKYRPH